MVSYCEADDTSGGDEPDAMVDQVLVGHRWLLIGHAHLQAIPDSSHGRSWSAREARRRYNLRVNTILAIRINAGDLHRSGPVKYGNDLVEDNSHDEGMRYIFLIHLSVLEGPWPMREFYLRMWLKLFLL